MASKIIAIIVIFISVLIVVMSIHKYINPCFHGIWTDSNNNEHIVGQRYMHNFSPIDEENDMYYLSNMLYTNHSFLVGLGKIVKLRNNILHIYESRNGKEKIVGKLFSSKIEDRKNLMGDWKDILGDEYTIGDKNGDIALLRNNLTGETSLLFYMKNGTYFTGSIGIKNKDTIEWMDVDMNINDIWKMKI